MFVESNLMDAESIMTVAEGCDYIVHTASPVAGIVEVEDEDVVIKPAVNGTLAVMKAAQKSKVKKVVITSSIAAVGFGRTGGLTEKDWTDVNTEGLPTYDKSKTLAERAAWEFIAELPDDEKFPLVTINPANVFGPNVSTAPTSSFGFALALVQGHLPKPGLNWYETVMQHNSVDVRDVSQAHLEAVLRDEASDKRFILCAESESETEPAFYVGNRAVEVLGIKYTGHTKSMTDMKASMIATGCIEADNVAVQQ